MRKRTKNDYVRLFNAIKSFDRQYNPDLEELDITAFSSDYEKAFISACKDAFPNAALKKCAFHYLQALSRKLKGIFEPYFQKVPAIAMLWKKLKGVPMMPWCHNEALILIFFLNI